MITQHLSTKTAEMTASVICTLRAWWLCWARDDWTIHRA